MSQSEGVDISPLKKRFQQACRWIIYGSLIFESGKAVHFFFLIRFLKDNAYFGIIGSLFSMVYLTARIVDLGATNSIPPYWHRIARSKQNFVRLLFTYFFLPSLPVALIAPFVTLSLFTAKFPEAPLYLFLIPILIILEAFRSFFRLLLHVAGKTSRVVGFDLFAFAIFIAAIWIPLLFFNAHPSMNQLFIPFLIDTVASVAYMGSLVWGIYKKLPDEPVTITASIWKKLSQVRGLNLMLRAGRDIFTDNLLTPLFAVKCGLAHAGIFYFASQLAKLLREILKGPLIYSGNALLAELKTGSLAHKKAAFSELSLKLMSLLIPIILILLVNFHGLLHIAQKDSVTGLTINFTLLFLLITLSESLFIMYEQFYIIEEATGKLFIFKVLDFILFYIVIFSQKALQPIPALLAIIGIRALSFVLIAMNAFFTWKIIPNVFIGWKAFVRWGAVAVGLAFVVHYCTPFWR